MTVVTSKRRGPVRPPKNRWAPGARSGYLYVLPAVIFFGLFILIPTLHTVFLSFFEWNGLTDRRWVGAANFLRLVEDPLLSSALLHAIIFLAFFVALPIGLGLFITALVGSRQRRGLTMFRAIFFVPQVVPLIAIGIIWRWMYSTEGVVAEFGAALGLPGPGEGWLGSFSTALPALGLVGTWALYGLCLTLFLTGAQRLSPDLYQAVRVDGGGKFWEFRAVTLPGLRREIGIAAVLTGVAALASFDLVYIATRGGPGDSTVVPGLLVYRLAFTSGDIGGASALAVALTIITIGYVLLVNKLTSKAD